MKFCKYCNKEVSHAISHTLTRGPGKPLRKIYMDNQGRLWEAARCPDCSGKYRLGKTQKLRDNSKGLPKLKLTDRKCTICSLPLPEGRRYFHEECQSIASSRYYDIDSDYSFKI